MSQCNSGLNPVPFAVRTAMPQTLRHAAGDLDARPRTYNAGYSTHSRQSNAADGRCTASHNGMTGSRFAASRITLWIGLNRGAQPHTNGSPPSRKYDLLGLM